MEKIHLYNQISREIVKNYNMYLHCEDVKVLNTLDVPPHYTISHIINKSFSQKIHELALKLKSIDKSLTINSLENYHITLFWKGIDSKLDEKSSEIKDIINSTNFEFSVEELLFGPLGISIKFYPKTEDFVNARMKLYELTGTPINIDERFVTTWVSLATYSQTPDESVKDFVRENSNIKLGEYQPENFTLYISNNKGLINPKKIIDFTCKI